jgi:PAS domain S-box-containing protein
MDAKVSAQAALDAIAIPTLVLDPDLRIVGANLAIGTLREKIGLAPNCLGKYLWEALPIDRNLVEERYRKLFSSGEQLISDESFQFGDHSVNLEVMRFPIVQGSCVTHVLVMGRDITNQGRLEASLRESEETSRALVEAATEAIILIDVTGVVLAINEIAVGRLKHAPDYIVGQSASKLFSPEEWERELALIQRVRETRQRVHSRGTRFGRLVDTTMTPITDASGTVYRIAIYDCDITDREAVVSALRESEETARALMNASSESIVLFDAHGRIVTLNETAAQRLGQSVAELVGKSGQDIFPPDIWAPRLAGIQEIVRTRRSLRYVDTHRGRSLHANVYPVSNSQGEVIRVAVFARDVTEHERAVAALQESEETARALINASVESIILMDRDETIVALNEIAATRMGLSVAEAVGRTAGDVFSADLVSARHPHVKTVLATRRPVRFTDSHSGRTFDNSIHPILGSSGEVQRIAIYARDITEHLEAMAALRDSEVTSRALINASAESIILMTPDGTVITMNAVAAARVGKLPHEAIGLNGSQIFPAEVWEQRKMKVAEVMQSRKPVTFTDTRFNKTVDVAIHPILDGLGVVQRVAVYARDISEHLAAMRAVRESETRYRRQFESLPVPTFVWEKVDDDFVLQDFNRAALELTLGHAPRFVGSKATTMYADRPDIVQDMIMCAQEGQPISREMSYAFKASLGVRYILAYYIYVPPNQVMVHAIDQTERKLAEVAVQEARRTLEQEVAKRTEELAQANEQLNVEREALDRKNIALQQVIEQAGRNRDDIAERIQANVDRIVLPILDRIDTRLDTPGKQYLKLARSSLMEIVSPYVRALETKSRNLTLHEIDLCHLIRGGHSTKEIAALRNTSVQTVLTQRKILRRKLGIVGREVNLASFLVSMTSETTARDYREADDNR